MTSPKHKHPLSPTIGYGVLMLQALTTPFAFASAAHPTTDQPTWALGLFLATDLAALAALGLIAVGRHTGRSRARFAPLTLVAPVWVAIALLSPFQHDSLLASALYSLYALVVAALSAGPFLTADGAALFDAARHASSRTLTTARLPE